MTQQNEIGGEWRVGWAGRRAGRLIDGVGAVRWIVKAYRGGLK